MIKFYGDSRDSSITAYKDGECVAIINIHYNSFTSKYFYVVDGKNFKRKFEAMRYVRENY